jgi:hypothetical protein
MPGCDERVGKYGLRMHACGVLAFLDVERSIDERDSNNFSKLFTADTFQVTAAKPALAALLNQARQKTIWVWRNDRRSI